VPVGKVYIERVTDRTLLTARLRIARGQKLEQIGSAKELSGYFLYHLSVCKRIASKVRLLYRAIPVLSLFLMSSCVFFSIESDRSLLRKFNKNRLLFEDFVTLKNEKGPFSIYNRDGRCELLRGLPKLNQTELEIFCSKMRRMGVEMIHDSEFDLTFDADTEWFSGKGYVFRVKPPFPTVLAENLDKVRELGLWYRHIDLMSCRYSGV